MSWPWHDGLKDSWNLGGPGPDKACCSSPGALVSSTSDVNGARTGSDTAKSPGANAF